MGLKKLNRTMLDKALGRGSGVVERFSSHFTWAVLRLVETLCCVAFMFIPLEVGDISRPHQLKWNGTPTVISAPK